MIDIEDITRKIREEKDVAIAKAFTIQIATLLRNNKITPIITEHKVTDKEGITDSNQYKLIFEYGVTFDELDTTKHDIEICRKFAESLKETFNQEFPSNYPSTKPYFTLENVRKLVDEVLAEMEKES